MNIYQAKIIKVYEEARHCYDGSQVETAIRVLLSNGRRCWLVGYGADYLPAKKSDIANMYDFIKPESDTVNREVGNIVWAYRDLPSIKIVNR